MRRTAIPGLVVLAILRLPSLMEPHWYTDEAGYVNVARELLVGKVLYLQTWNNKPPLMLWTIALEVKLFGSSEVALHVLTFISGAIALAAIVWAAGRLYTPRRALVAGVIAGVILGLPIVDAELALPESLLIAPLSWAGAIILVHILRRDPTGTSGRIPRWPLAAGVLMAAAIAYQQTAVAETSAFFLALLLAPKLLRRDAFLFLGTVVAITLVWLTAAITTAGAGKVAFALAGFYVDYTKKALPTSAAGGVAHFALAIAAAALIAAGAIASRRRDRVDWVLMLWAGATLVVTAVAGQQYPHFLAPAVAPLTLLVVGFRMPSSSWFRRERGARSSVRVCRERGWSSPSSWRGSPGSTGCRSSPRRPTRTRSAGTTVARSRPSSTRRGEPPGSTTSTTGSPATPVSPPGSPRTGSAATPPWSGPMTPGCMRSQTCRSTCQLRPSTTTRSCSDTAAPSSSTWPRERPVLIVVDCRAQALFPEIGTLLAGGEYVDEYASSPDTVWVRADRVAQLP